MKMPMGSALLGGRVSASGHAADLIMRARHVERQIIIRAFAHARIRARQRKAERPERGIASQPTVQSVVEVDEKEPSALAAVGPC